MSVAHIKSTRQVTRRLVVSRLSQLACRDQWELIGLVRGRLKAAGFDLSKRIEWRQVPEDDRGGTVYKQTVEVMAGE